MKVVFQKAYDYILIEDIDGCFLTFFTGGPVEIDICVQLNDEEIRKVCNSQEETEKLVRLFMSDRRLFEDRRR